MAEADRLLRIGFVGCGRHATTSIWPALHYAPVEIAYACDMVPELAERNRRRYSAERAVTDVDEVLADPSVEAVFVIGPPDMHHEVGLRVLDAGKHLFIEKPPGGTLAHALELEAAAQRNGVQCQVGFMKRFALAYKMARDVASRPEFGGVRLCKLNYSHWRMPVFNFQTSDWRFHLAYSGTHAVDLARFFMGDPVEAHVLKREADDGRNTCVLTLIYESGASAVVNMSTCDPHVQEWVELSGANQLISVRDLVDYRHWADPGEKFMVMNEAQIGMWHPAFTIPYQQADSRWLQGYAGEVVAFAEALIAGDEVSPSIADGVESMRFVEAIIDAPEGMSQLDLALNRSGSV